MSDSIWDNTYLLVPMDNFLKSSKPVASKLSFYYHLTIYNTNYTVTQTTDLS